MRTLFLEVHHGKYPTLEQGRLQIKAWEKGEYLGAWWVEPELWELLKPILIHGTSYFEDNEIELEIQEFREGEEVFYHG